MSPTRRDFLATTTAAALAAAMGRPSVAQGPRAPLQPAQPQPVFTPVRRNVGTFTMRGGTVGWLVDGRGVAVVDTQFPPEARVLIEGLRARTGGRGVDVVLNTHHHGDHAGGNPAFRGIARRVVAHAMAAQHMRRPPGLAPPPPPAADAPAPLHPDTTFTHAWTADVGDERIVARHHGRAHTSGDVVVTFERANVAHMGDLMFHRRHPVVDRAAGASMRNWARLLEQVVAGHARDTIYIFGHAGAGLPITGSGDDLLAFRDYLDGVLAMVEREIAAGRTRDEIVAMRAPLAGFEAWGPFGPASARDPITVAYDETAHGV